MAFTSLKFWVLNTTEAIALSRQYFFLQLNRLANSLDWQWLGRISAVQLINFGRHLSLRHSWSGWSRLSDVLGVRGWPLFVGPGRTKPPSRHYSAIFGIYLARLAAKFPASDINWQTTVTECLLYAQFTAPTPIKCSSYVLWLGIR